jgi:RimJ/RimL family protein N-acetyltransferase
MAAYDIGVGLATVIETDRLRLERWDDAHFLRFARFMRNPEVIRYIRRRPLDAREALEQHEHSLADWEAYGFGKRAVIEAETGAWLGFIELSLVGPGKGSRDDDVEIGYFIEPSRWGEGIATEAAFALRDEAFGRCELSELIGRCRVENVASSRVLEKVGFRLLRLFELRDGIVVEIHHVQREDWTPPPRRSSVSLDPPPTGAEYRETG